MATKRQAAQILPHLNGGRLHALRLRLASHDHGNGVVDFVVLLLQIVEGSGPRLSTASKRSKCSAIASEATDWVAPTGCTTASNSWTAGSSRKNITITIRRRKAPRQHKRESASNTSVKRMFAGRVCGKYSGLLRWTRFGRGETCSTPHNATRPVPGRACAARQPPSTAQPLSGGPSR